MHPLTRDEIVSSFSVSDRDLVEPPAIEELHWGDLDYLGWKSSSHRGFIVCQWDEKLVGLVLRFTGSTESSRTGNCNLCLSVHHDSGTTMVMIDSWHQPRTSHGIHICRELNCSENVRGLGNVGVMRETISNGHRIERLQTNLNRFIATLTEKK